MSQQTVTLRQVFELPNAGAVDRSPDRWEKFEARMEKEVKTIKWPAAIPDLAKKFVELFDVKIPDILFISWKKADAIRLALAESKKTPEATKYLELADHTITSKHRPHIDVMIYNKSVKKIEFVVTLTFKLKGFVLKIKAGEIEEIRTGRCEIEGKVQYEDLTIAEKKLAPIDLPALCSFKSEPVLHLYDSRPAATPAATV